MAEPCGYDVIVDRISHDIPFYRVVPEERRAAPAPRSSTTRSGGAPTTSSSTTRWPTKLGVAVPPTVLLPHKKHPPGTTERSMRNLQYPLDWDGDLRVRRLPRVPQAVRRRRLERRLQGRHTARSSSPPTTRRATLCMTLQRGGELRGVLPLLRGRSGEGARHALRPARAASTSATCRNPPAYAEGSASACVERDALHALPRARLRPEHRGVRRGGRHSVRHRLHESGARRRTCESVGPENFDWIVERGRGHGRRSRRPSRAAPPDVSLGRVSWLRCRRRIRHEPGPR